MSFHLKQKLTYFIFCAAIAFGVDVSTVVLDPCGCDAQEAANSDSGEQEDEPDCDCCAIVCQCTHQQSTMHVSMMVQVPNRDTFKSLDNLFHDSTMVSRDFYDQLYRPPIA